ncbi:MAG: carbohydrate ABC transporter permease [Desertifilum sp. SIO1I2]|nr:carbohydrate ABC transporter permease [Desertifilum sp. SIO1I2]
MATTVNTAPPKSTNTGKLILKKVVFPLGLAFLIIFCLAPALWQLLTSIKVNEAIAAFPNVYFPRPDQYTLQHYQDVLFRRPFLRYTLNSFLVSMISTLLALALGAPAAYALARLRLRGEQILLGTVLIITLFPFVLVFLGLLEIMQIFQLGNNYLALIIPYTGINLPLTILVMRSFFLQLPKDLEDSAKVDGYSTWNMLLRIVLPMTLPAMVTTGILTFISAWNEFIFALTFMTREEMKTIPVGTAQLGGATTFEIPYGAIAAATVMGTIPLVLLVLFFQRKIVQGLTAGAVKG